MEAWWTQVEAGFLAQGDWLPDCIVPEMPADFEPPLLGEDTPPVEFIARITNLIVVTQSCDLEQRKIEVAALCPIYRLDEFEEANPGYRKRGTWEQVRQGRMVGLHLLASPTQPARNSEALVVDFRVIHSLPVAYLERYAARLGERWRLKSPYLEHFSQAFARFFMRVGLPSDIPRFE